VANPSSRAGHPLFEGRAEIAGAGQNAEHTHGAPWEPNRVYLAGDIVTDDDVHPAMGAEEYPTPGGRFRARVDHYSGVLGPRFLEVDAPEVWERVETIDVNSLPEREGGQASA
jgi:hypothetical protein